MKKLSILGLLAILLVGPFFASAQTADQHPPKVEIMPSAPGFLKILYVNKDENKVKVTISGGNGLIFADRIKVDEGFKGFCRKYNLMQLEPGLYSVEVSNRTMTVKYQFDLLDDHKVFAHYWKWTDKTLEGDIIASN